ncbi:MAG: chemotaxis protein CheW [bacterium]
MENTLNLLVLEAGSVEFLVPLDFVKEIISFDFTEFEQSGTDFIKLRGERIRFYDLKNEVNLKTEDMKISLAKVILILKIDSYNVAVLVNKVSDIISVNSDKQIYDFNVDFDNHYIKSMIKIDERNLYLLNESLFSRIAVPF